MAPTPQNLAAFYSAFQAFCDGRSDLPDIRESADGEYGEYQGDDLGETGELDPGESYEQNEQDDLYAFFAQKKKPAQTTSTSTKKPQASVPEPPHTGSLKHLLKKGPL